MTTFAEREAALAQYARGAQAVMEAIRQIRSAVETMDADPLALMPLLQPAMDEIMDPDAPALPTERKKRVKSVPYPEMAERIWGALPGTLTEIAERVGSTRGAVEQQYRKMCSDPTYKNRIQSVYEMRPNPSGTRTSNTLVISKRTELVAVDG